MKYLMLIYGNEEKWASFPAEAWPEAIAKQDAFNKKYAGHRRAARRLRAGHRRAGPAGAARSGHRAAGRH